MKSVKKHTLRWTAQGQSSKAWRHEWKHHKI